VQKGLYRLGILLRGALFHPTFFSELHGQLAKCPTFPANCQIPKRDFMMIFSANQYFAGGLA
jgi:hypothetical protein